MAQRAWRAAELAQRLQIRHPTVQIGTGTQASPLHASAHHGVLSLPHRCSSGRAL
jgi:hypothetical protein